MFKFISPLPHLNFDLIRAEMIQRLPMFYPNRFVEQVLLTRSQPIEILKTDYHEELHPIQQLSRPLW